MGPESVHEQPLGLVGGAWYFLSNTKIMASNGSDSFFIPETPLPTKTEKATWEMLSNDAKFSHVCKTLMDDSDSDSDVIVLTEAEKEMFLQDHALLPQPEKKDRLASMKEDQEQTKLNLKISEKTKTVRRVGRNMEYGIHNHNHKKSKKVEQLWNYVEQTLVKNLVIEVLPLPQLKSTFLKPNIMTMEKVTDSSVKGVLQKFNTPQTKQTMLSDIQTENLGSLTFRRLIVRKRLAPGKYTFAVLPNMVMSSDQKVFYFAPDSVWYEKITTNNRSKEMTIPKPFQGNQSVDVLFQNTFSWDV